MIYVLLGLAVVTTASAQQRVSCVRTNAKATTRGYGYTLPLPMDFDPNKIYRQPVVLISFSDADFSMENPKEYYNRFFNEKGFNEGAGTGCAADYFRDQSGGRLNLQFDIYGPFKVDFTAGGHNGKYYGEDVMTSAINQLCVTETTDFSIYDWDGDGKVDQVLFISAGYSGNQIKGYIWPSTSTLRVKLPGGIYGHFYSIGGELWRDGVVGGFGIIAHEFCHCLGLPDIYPLGQTTMFSAADEWDIMDGGDYTNRGWCPSNFTAMERMYMKWEQPEELNEPTTITGMKPLGAGGKSYIIRNSGDSEEYYLLENRQQVGWDYGCPGSGLLISHVDYMLSSWADNEVNISDDHFRFDLFHADGKDYITWDPSNNGGNVYTKYTMDGFLRSKFLSTSAYPYTNPDTQVLNDMLTDTSSPASVLYSNNAEGVKLMGKSITNIRVADDGTVSFDFMKGSTGINAVVDTQSNDNCWYDLLGRRLTGKPTRKGVYIQESRKILVK
jgi:M6 family metalloprotease-like protein